jgi:hypothetical protein
MVTVDCVAPAGLGVVWSVDPGAAALRACAWLSSIAPPALDDFVSRRIQRKRDSISRAPLLAHESGRS